MSSLLPRIRELVGDGKSRVSDHGFRELKEDGISLADILQGLKSAEVVEEYPDYHKGPCILILQRDAKGMPVHILWGTSNEERNEAVLITAYRPDPTRWSADFRKRMRK
ncbi:MAG: DUF4258 domain-containing protein [Rhizobiaceae bacterium]